MCSVRVWRREEEDEGEEGGGSCARAMEVGFLGLGIMGKAMAANLLRHGFRVTVWNRTLSKVFFPSILPPPQIGDEFIRVIRCP